MSNKLHIYRFSLLSPLFKNLELQHQEMSFLCRKNALEKFDFSNRSFLGTPKIHDFLQDVWLARTSRKFISEYACDYSIKCIIDPNLLREGTNDIWDVLINFINIAPSIKSNIKIGLDIEVEKSTLRFEFPEERSLGKRIMEQLWLLLCLDIFKYYFGCSWKPLELHVPCTALDSMSNLLPTGAYPIKYEESEYRILFRNEACVAQNGQISPFSYERGYHGTKDNELANLNKIIMSYAPGYRPKLSDLANQFNLSARTIKRILESSNTTFRKLSSDCLLNKALVQLRNRSLSIEEISDNLGYSDSPNFIRSFKALTGITPAAYRDTNPVGYSTQLGYLTGHA